MRNAYKRLKHVLHLESVSGPSQQALIIGVAAKVLADNLASLMCLTAEKIHHMHAAASAIAAMPPGPLHAYCRPS